MPIDEKNIAEAILQTAVVGLENKDASMDIYSYYNRSRLQVVNIEDDISIEELAQMQIILLQEAARDVGLDFDFKSRKSITEFKEKLKAAIFTKAGIAEDALKKHVCDELEYCEKVAKNWRGKLLFGSGLALATLLVDLTGISLAGILFLLSTGYFDELCECNKVKMVGA